MALSASGCFATPMPTTMRASLIALLLGSPILSSAQEVIGAGGAYHTSGTAGLSYTIGEPVTATVGNASTTLTQGFQQPWADINTVVDDPVTDGPSINVYPNPVRHVLHIAMDGTPEGHHYVLHDAAGRQVTDGRIGSTITDLDMEPFASGSYYLRVLGPNDNSGRSFKISVTH